jgi:RNA polymerase sigma-70 factor (ECF subfamily)
MEMPFMTDEHEQTSELVRRAAAGETMARDELFTRYRQRLKRMVRLRLNRHLQGRVDESDIVQESALDAARHFDDYLRDPSMPFYLWLRHITGRKLIDAHRRHLGARQRDAAQEVSLHRGALPAADSISLAAQLLGRLTGPARAAIRAETRVRVQQVLNSMDPIDREVLALRHFEQMTSAEAAQVLDLTEAAASSRYLRALKRLKDELKQIPGLFDRQK